jgi:hypothetical protein
LFVDVENEKQIRGKGKSHWKREINSRWKENDDDWKKRNCDSSSNGWKENNRRRQMQGEKEQRLQQQQAERERQKAVSIEERQRMEEHQESINNRKRKRPRFLIEPGISTNSQSVFLPASKKDTPNLLERHKNFHHLFLRTICGNGTTTINST